MSTNHASRRGDAGLSHESSTPLRGSPHASPRANPYDTAHLEFFDTTHVDRLDSGWLFDDPDHALYAQASRAATGFCDDKDFNGGRFTGHYIGERDGVLCTPTTAAFFDATDAEIDATGWGFADINTAPWAQVARRRPDSAARAAMWADSLPGTNSTACAAWFAWGVMLRTGSIRPDRIC